MLSRDLDTARSKQNSRGVTETENSNKLKQFDFGHVNKQPIRGRHLSLRTRLPESAAHEYRSQDFKILKYYKNVFIISIRF